MLFRPCPMEECSQSLAAISHPSREHQRWKSIQPQHPSQLGHTCIRPTRTGVTHASTLAPNNGWRLLSATQGLVFLLNSWSAFFNHSLPPKRMVLAWGWLLHAAWSKIMVDTYKWRGISAMEPPS